MNVQVIISVLIVRVVQQKTIR